MPRTRLSLVICLLSPLLLPIHAVHAESCDYAKTGGLTTVQVDHAAATVLCPEQGQWKAMTDDLEIRVHSGSVRVEVLNTNTAIFDHKLTTEVLKVPEAEQLSGFLTGFGPYAIDLLATAVTPSEARATQVKLSDPEKQQVALLRHIDDLNLQVQQVQIAANAALADFGRRDLSHVRATFTSTYSKATLQSVIDELIWSYGVLAKVTRDQQLTPTEASKVDDLVQRKTRGDIDRAKLVERVSAALKQAASAIAAASGVLGLAETIVAATDTKLLQPHSIRPNKGRLATLKITRKKIGDAAPHVTQPEIDAKLRLLPQWTVRPTLGLSLLYSADSEFPVYSTEELDDDQGFEIIEKEIEDERFTYGLTLGLTHRAWDNRSHGGWTPWLDLTVNPSDDVKAVGVGLAIQKGFWRFGTGWLWTKHEGLRGGFAAGDVLDGETAPIRETYGDGELYFAFSVTGWPPFVPE